MPKAVGFRILVKVKKLNKSAGGIYYPEDLKNKQDEARLVAEVIEIGPDAFSSLKSNPSRIPWCKVGDIVYISRFSGMEFKEGTAPIYEDYNLRLINDEDILGIFEEGDPI